VRPGSSLAAGQPAAVAPQPTARSPRPRPVRQSGARGRPGGGRRSLPAARPASLLLARGRPGQALPTRRLPCARCRRLRPRCGRHGRRRGHRAQAAVACALEGQVEDQCRRRRGHAGSCPSLSIASFSLSSILSQHSRASPVLFPLCYLLSLCTSLSSSSTPTTNRKERSPAAPRRLAPRPPPPPPPGLPPRHVGEEEDMAAAAVTCRPGPAPARPALVAAAARRI
jgi:hypothetical protein